MADYYPPVMQNHCFNCPHYRYDRGQHFCQSKEMHAILYKDYFAKYISRNLEDYAEEYPELADYDGKPYSPIYHLLLLLDDEYKFRECPVFLEVKRQQLAEKERLAEEARIAAKQAKEEEERLLREEAERRAKAADDEREQQQDPEPESHPDAEDRRYQEAEELRRHAELEAAERAKYAAAQQDQQSEPEPEEDEPQPEQKKKGRWPFSR